MKIYTAQELEETFNSLDGDERKTILAKAADLQKQNPGMPYNESVALAMGYVRASLKGGFVKK